MYIRMCTGDSVRLRKLPFSFMTQVFTHFLYFTKYYTLASHAHVRTYVSAVNRLPMPSYCADMSRMSTHRYVVVVQASHSLHEGHLDLLVGQGVSEDKILKAGEERGRGQYTVETGGRYEDQLFSNF